MTEKSTHEQTGENNFSIKVEHFIIDLKEKKVSLPYRYTKDISLDDVEHLPFEYEDLDDFKYDDSFPDVLNAEIQGKELTLKHDAKDNLYLFANNVRIMKTNANHEITELYLPTTKEIPDHCLMYNKTLEKFSAPNVQRIGAAFLCNNISLTDLNAPKLEIIDSFILRQNKKLKKIDLPSVSKIGYAFLENNEDCQSVNLPSVLEIGSNFLRSNKVCRFVNLPWVREIGHHFLRNNTDCTSLNIPNVQDFGWHFLSANKKFAKLSIEDIRALRAKIITSNQFNNYMKQNQNERS